MKKTFWTKLVTVVASLEDGIVNVNISGVPRATRALLADDLFWARFRKTAVTTHDGAVESFSLVPALDDPNDIELVVNATSERLGALLGTNTRWGACPKGADFGFVVFGVAS